MCDGYEFAEQLLASPAYYKEVAEYLAVAVQSHPGEGYGVFIIDRIAVDHPTAEVKLEPTGAGAEDGMEDYRLNVNVDRAFPTKLLAIHRTERGHKAGYDEVGGGIEDIRSFASSTQLACCDAIGLSPEAIYQAVGVRVRENASDAAQSGGRSA